MSKIVFLYPGQGVQRAGMGRDFYENSPRAREIYERASETLGFDIKKLCFEKNDKLDLTEYTQAALVTTFLAMTAVVKDAGLKADITAGLSVGEYAAIVAAGGMKEMDAVRLVRKRGILMQNTIPIGQGAMCAVMAMKTENIEQVLKDMEDVTIANYNCPGQIVITGQKAAVEKAKKALKAAGAKHTIMLKLSAPFHSPMLKKAGDELKEELEKVKVYPLEIPYITNVGAKKVTDASEIRVLLEKQVTAPVCWMQSMEYLIKNGADVFVEIGPGRTLAGFMKRINRNVKTINIEAMADIKKLQRVAGIKIF